jgi:AcrR family transcriptional regulator
MMATETDDLRVTRSGRTRDPGRKEKIIRASVSLIAENGFHDVSMAEIGAEAGIVGSGVYRHFESKSAILVEVFERVIDSLLVDQKEILDSGQEPADAFAGLIDGQIDFVVGDRAVALVYHHEVHNLPDSDRRRLRRKQRIYLEGWVQLLQEQRRTLDDSSARTLVHCSIGAIQSTLFHNVGLAEEQLRDVLRRAAIAALNS